jgi:sirohydrochlorin ferrochelatase
MSHIKERCFPKSSVCILRAFRLCVRTLAVLEYVPMKTIIVLAMHGMPPADFPGEELAEFFKLQSITEAGKGGGQKPMQDRYAFLDKKIRTWLRNEQNDPFHAASRDLATHLSQESGSEVVVGYNEFCAPTIDEALQSAVDKKANRIIVVTPMMTRGGKHAEKDIPAAIEEFRELHPEIQVIYAWPFDTAEVAGFLSGHISPFA